LGLFWLKERLTRMQWLGTAVALSGAIIIGFQPGELLRLGSLFVLLSSFMYALHVAIVKRYGGEIEFANFFLYRVAFTTAFLLLFVIGQRQMVWPTGEVWIFLILTGTVDVVISRVLYYLALRQMTLSMHTIILMLSPVITIGWSLLLFGEAPTLQSFIGGVVIIGGILIVNFARK
jgi:drug/metabolite transporter (DMT)-like permease